MTEREKVIEHLNEIAEYFRGCRSNASFASKAENHFWELKNAASEAAELLKAQEPVKPFVTGNGHTFEEAETWWYECGNCNEPIDPNDQYCRHCGRAVKWDG